MRANRVCRGTHSSLRQVLLQLVVAQPFLKFPTTSHALKTRPPRPLPPDAISTSSPHVLLPISCPVIFHFTSVRFLTRYRSTTSTEASSLINSESISAALHLNLRQTSPLSFPQLRSTKTFHSQDDNLLQPAGAGPQVLLTHIWSFIMDWIRFVSEWILRSCLIISYLSFHYAYGQVKAKARRRRSDG